MLTQFAQNIYRIDRLDNIVFVNEAWDQFAVSNEGSELVETNMIGRSLWDFVTDEMTRHVYKEMVASIRSGESMQFDFRCDSPDERRFFQMRMTQVPNGGVQFETNVVHVEQRDAQEIFRRSSSNSEEIVVTCSWCKKINTGEDVWHEAEEAVRILRLFDLHPTPRLSHGMCFPCYEETIEKLRARRADGNE